MHRENTEKGHLETLTMKFYHVEMALNSDSYCTKYFYETGHMISSALLTMDIEQSWGKVGEEKLPATKWGRNLERNQNETSSSSLLRQRVRL